MATYAIGDIQGCYRSLLTLLEKINFASDDTLWLAGDLVNRGPDSLETLRFVKSLGKQAKVVLGNHDLHLLALRAGVERKLGKTLTQVMEAEDCNELLDWLQLQPLLVDSEELGFVMTHAGIPHIWDLNQAKQFADEIEQCLASEQAVDFFHAMYGNSPSNWDSNLAGNTRLRVITNYLTRMRFIAEDGTLDFEANGGLETQPQGFKPWFEFPTQVNTRTQITGHWAALGLREGKDHIALDTGCVWGGKLTALCLDNRQITSVESQEI